MRVGLLIHELDIKGGTHKQLVILANYLNSVGHTVSVYTKSYELGLYDLAPNIKVNVFKVSKSSSKVYRLFSRIYSSILIGYAAKKDTDIVQVHDNWLNYSIITLAIFRHKILWQINDLNPCFREGAAALVKERFYFRFDRFVNKLAAKLTTRFTVNVTKNKIRIQNSLQHNARIDVLYCGVDLKYDALPNKTPTDDILLFSLGVFLEYRNYETVIAVHKKLLEQGISVKTTIAGSQKLAPEYAEKICKLAEDTSSIEILSQVSDKKLLDLFQQSKFFLFINVDQSWGLAVFESMNAGTPVVLSKSVGAIEVLKDGVDVIEVDPFDVSKICDQIHFYHKNKKMYEQLRVNSFETVSKMTWENMYCEKVNEILFEEKSR